MPAHQPDAHEKGEAGEKQECRALVIAGAEAEIETLDSDLAVVRAAHDLALNELLANAGMGEQAFSKLADSTTRETDGG